MSEAVNELQITVVFDNNPYDERLRTSWGFGCYIEGAEKTILFDTGGSGQILLANMDKLGIDPESVDVVVISHAHRDHCGGLVEFMERTREKHLSVFVPASVPGSMKQGVREAGAELIEVTQPTRICRGVYSTGELGTAIREQSLVIETGDGLIVITGCAHPGIVNTVRNAESQRDADVHMALGGFHLLGAATAEIRRITQELKELGVKQIGPCHCSGHEARRVFQEAYGENFLPLGVGYHLDFRSADAD